MGKADVNGMAVARGAQPAPLGPAIRAMHHHSTKACILGDVPAVQPKSVAPKGVVIPHQSLQKCICFSPLSLRHCTKCRDGVAI